MIQIFHSFQIFKLLIYIYDSNISIINLYICFKNFIYFKYFNYQSIFMIQIFHSFQIFKLLIFIYLIQIFHLLNTILNKNNRDFFAF
jgi:hypothetical protein